jgi:hypothetical protein
MKCGVTTIQLQHTLNGLYADKEVLNENMKDKKHWKEE